MPNILLVEDNEHDVIAIRRSCRKEGDFTLTVCSRAEEALPLLAEPGGFDIALVDHGLPGMKGLDLCRKILDEKIPLPTVLLTGEGSESLAVEALKAGVADYMIKAIHQGYLDLLPLVVRDVIRRFRDREARRVAEERYRLLVRNAPIGIFRATLGGKLLEVNPAMAALYGYASPMEMIAATGAADLYVTEGRREALLRELKRKGEVSHFESRQRTKAGDILRVTENVRMAPAEGTGEPCIEGFVIDITDRKKDI